MLFTAVVLHLLNCGETDPNLKAPDAAVKNKGKPNIVLLIGDDQGYPYFGFMGADYVNTPNMDRLAESGTLFTQGYVPANHCRPSLQTLLTGTLPIQYEQEVEKLLEAEKKKNRRYADLTPEDKNKWETDFRHHAMKNFETLPKYLKKEGYVTFQGGKWWEFHYENGGFDEGMTTGWTEEERKDGSRWFKKFMGGDGLKLGRATIEPVYDFIEKNAGKPFFIWYAPELPHYPFDAPEKYYAQYKDRENFSESAKRYYANCTWFDDGVGELVSYLKEKDLYVNTLFIYVNDNGWEQAPTQEFKGDGFRWNNGGDKGKLSMFDQSFHTPIIFSWKGKIKAGERRADLMASADILPTILDLIGAEIPDDLWGKSYKPVILDGEKGGRDVVIGRITQLRSDTDAMGRQAEGYWLRSPEWFFKWNVTDKKKALFDMKKDPNNDTDVLPEHPDLEKEFTARIEDWKRRVTAE